MVILRKTWTVFYIYHLQIQTQECFWWQPHLAVGAVNDCWQVAGSPLEVVLQIMALVQVSTSMPTLHSSSTYYAMPLVCIFTDGLCGSHNASLAV